MDQSWAERNEGVKSKEAHERYIKQEWEKFARAGKSIHTKKKEPTAKKTQEQLERLLAIKASRAEASRAEASRTETKRGGKEADNGAEDKGKRGREGEN